MTLGVQQVLSPMGLIATAPELEGTVSAFQACFPKAPGVADAGDLFAALAGGAP